MPKQRQKERRRQVRLTLRNDLFDHFEEIAPGSQTIDELEYLLRFAIRNQRGALANVAPLANERLMPSREPSEEAPPSSAAAARKGWNLGSFSAAQ